MSTNGLSAKIVTITPKLALQLLGRNTHNRSVVQARVDQYATDMRKGDWQVNGEAIKISSDGQILDGQHRLMAVLEADTSIESLLITGLPPAAQETMDTSTWPPRSGSSASMSATSSGAGRPAVNGSVKQLSRTLERNPEIRDSVKLAASLRRSWLGVSVMAGMHYLFATADRDDADDFINKLATGESLTSADPIYVLRERLIKEHYDAGGLHSRVKFAFLVRAWNAYRRGETLSRLVWTPGGAHPDRFPEIDGLATAERPETPAGEEVSR